MSANSVWKIAEAEFPANSSPRQKLGFALKYVTLVSTEGHWKPWEFREGDAHLELIAKNDPVREVIDPEGRELLIGCGETLHYLKLALKHFSCLGRVALFPDLGEPALVARIHFGFCRERDTQEKLLFEAMSRTHADASPLGETPLSETMLAALSRAAAGERGWLDFVQSETSRQQVMKITLAGDPSWPSFARSRAETTKGAAQIHLPRTPRPLVALGGRNVDSWELAVAPARQASVPAATLAVVKTKTDDKHGWLAAGETMARTVLQARALGLSWAFFNPLRRQEARAAFRLGIGHKGFAQVILRLGSLAPAEMARSASPTATAAFQ